MLRLPLLYVAAENLTWMMIVVVEWTVLVPLMQ
jgi:hypothetical protein